ncbi:putative ATP-dependent RNA helicase DDX31 [Camelus ferus]|nr:putative ATP-dependent RNA helicase DDX31 [Camelus ferus]
MLHKQAEATKRRYHESSEAPPAKRRSKASCLPAKKTAAKETQGTFQGKALKTFSPKKSSAGGSNRNQERKPGIKTSSLFKNNPEIPELHRPVVKQVQEKVFTSDAFHELDLHPHLTSGRPEESSASFLCCLCFSDIHRLRDVNCFCASLKGKTLAYCIPVVQSLQAMESKIQRADGPYALILVPTRELALQSFETVQKLLKDITVILNAVNAECQGRQNVLLSATLTEGVTRLADISLHNPVSISVPDESYDPKSRAVLEASAPRTGSELDSFAIPAGLDQHVTVVPSKLRLVSLAAFILQKCKFERDQKMVVFFLSCELVEFHYNLFLQTLLGGSGAPAPGRLPSASTQFGFLRLHGDMEQEYNAPASPAEYIHRIGRTARIGCRGSSLLILAPSEAEYVNSLASHKINQTCQHSPHSFRVAGVAVYGLRLPQKVLHTLLPWGRRGPSPDGSAWEPFSLRPGNLRTVEGVVRATRKFTSSPPLPSAALWLVCARSLRVILEKQALTVVKSHGDCATQSRQQACRCHLVFSQSFSVMAGVKRTVILCDGSSGGRASGIREKADSVFPFRRERSAGRDLGSDGKLRKKSHAVGPQEIRERATVLQTVFEDYVHSSERTVSGAKKALQSFIRAYAAYPRELKHIFHVRFLHLGHVAKSFGLRDAPKNLSALSVKKKKANLKRQQVDRGVYLLTACDLPGARGSFVFFTGSGSWV